MADDNNDSIELANTLQDLFRLANPDNCKKLVVLTSKAISEHFTPRYITYLNKSIGGEKMTEEKLLFFNKDVLPPSVNKTKINSTLWKRMGNPWFELAPYRYF